VFGASDYMQTARAVFYPVAKPPNWFAPHDRYRRILPVPGRAREGLFTVATADIQVEAATARIRFEACLRKTQALPAMTRAHKLADRARLSGLHGSQ